jgi:hypothetical protein
LRKALLVVAMVAASFVGGAVVNGPMLAWFRGASGLDRASVSSLEDDALAAPVIVDEPAVASGADAGTPAGRDAAPAVTGPIEPTEPAAPPGPGQAEAETEAPAGSPPPGAPTPADAPGSESEPPRPLDLGGAAPPPLAAPSAPGEAEAIITAVAPAGGREPGWGDAPGSAPAVAFLPGSRPATPLTTPASATTAPTATATTPAADPARRDPVVTPAALPSTPTADDPPPSADAPGTPPDAPASRAPGGPTRPEDGSRWDVLRRRMAELGVSRYWIEGAPAGPVQFRCAVPVAGQGAVAQMFQAEADDAPAAAEAALRRIALWRAAARPR